MSVRLNVLLVQSSRMSGLQSEINAELVVQMMGVPGLDLSIVTSLKPAEASDTDQLLLSSLQSDLAILDWRDPSEMIHALGQAGIIGSRAPHRLDPSPAAVSAGARRLYFVDLRRGDPPHVIVEGLRALLNDRRIVAVPLMIPAGVKPPARSNSLDATPVPAVQQQTRVSGSAKRPGESDLDALVDGVNDVDW